MDSSRSKLKLNGVLNIVSLMLMAFILCLKQWATNAAPRRTADRARIDPHRVEGGLIPSSFSLRRDESEGCGEP